MGPVGRVVPRSREATLDEVGKLFDKWAESGRSEDLEREHTRSVRKFLSTVQLESPFSFLDVGCGNGWLVRLIAERKGCTRAVGIDKSPAMIRKAESMRRSAKERYVATDVESIREASFDYIFAMETLYFAESVEAALEKIYNLLKPGGMFFCGVDYYAENRATRRWASSVPVTMHLLSRSGWRRRFRRIGFKTRTRKIKDFDDRRAWRKEHGTLFITGTRPNA